MKIPNTPLSQDPRMERLVEVLADLPTARQEAFMKMLDEYCPCGAMDFDEGTAETLNEVVKWWRRHHGADVAEGRTMPDFKPIPVNEQVIRSFRFPRGLLEIAEKRVRTSRAAHTGGNLNKLMILLLWEFCGQPYGFLKGEDRPLDF